MNSARRVTYAQIQEQEQAVATALERVNHARDLLANERAILRRLWASWRAQQRRQGDRKEGKD